VDYVLDSGPLIYLLIWRLQLQMQQTPPSDS
jgi:hypothetical protein